MLSNLARSLIDKNVIKENTELEVVVKKNGLGSPVQVIELVTVNFIDDEAFSCSSVVDGRDIVVSPKQILSVDGMKPDRLASIYHIDSAGKHVAPGKKRGRRPKNQFLN